MFFINKMKAFSAMRAFQRTCNTLPKRILTNSWRYDLVLGGGNVYEFAETKGLEAADRLIL